MAFVGDRTIFEGYSAASIEEGSQREFEPGMALPDLLSLT